MAALNSTVASVPVRNDVFVLIDAKARTGKRGEGGGGVDSKVLGAYGRDVLHKNGKLFLGFAEDNTLSLLNAFFATSKVAFFTFQSANLSKGQARLDYILTEQADRRLLRCVNDHRRPLEAPESDHSLVRAKVRIPRRSAPNRRKRESTKETLRTADLRRLMTDPNHRCQVANAMIAALLPIPDGTCISVITTDMAGDVLSKAAKLAPRSKRPRGAQGWCGGPGFEAVMNVAWQQREEARRHLRAEPHSSNLQKAVKMAGKSRAELLLGLYSHLETRVREGDKNDLYKHLRTKNLEGKRNGSSAYIKNEDGIPLRDVELTRKRWVRWFHALMNAKSPKLDPNIAEGVCQWSENMPLEVQPTMQELTDAILSSANGKAVRPDGVSVELFKIPLNDDPALRRRLVDIVLCIWRGRGGGAQQWKHTIIIVLHKKKDRAERSNYRGISLVAHAGN